MVECQQIYSDDQNLRNNLIIRPSIWLHRRPPSWSSQAEILCSIMQIIDTKMIENVQQLYKAALDHIDHNVSIQHVFQHYKASLPDWSWDARSVMRSSVTRSLDRKKLSHALLTGDSTRSTPSTRTRTFLTPSGKRASAGSRTACVRLSIKTDPKSHNLPPYQLYEITM